MRKIWILNILTDNIVSLSDLNKTKELFLNDNFDSIIEDDDHEDSSINSSNNSSNSNQFEFEFESINDSNYLFLNKSSIGNF